MKFRPLFKFRPNLHKINLMVKIQIFVIIGMIVISACKKDSVHYPVTYSSHSISGVKIKVYTKNGEVTSTTQINNVFTHYQSYLTNLGSENISGKIVASYISRDSIELTNNTITEKKRRSVHEVAGMIYWEKQDTLWSAFGPFWNMDDLYQYLPLYYFKYPAPAGSGYTEYAKSRECYYIAKNGGHLNIPMFDFVRIISDFNFTTSTKGINNSFNKDGLSKFYSGYGNDTLLIQSYIIEMN